MVGEIHPNRPNQDEVDEDVLRPPFINNRCKCHKFLQSDGRVLRKVMEQGHLRLGTRDQRDLFAFLSFPNLQQNGVGYDVLVFDAHEHLVMAL